MTLVILTGEHRHLGRIGVRDLQRRRGHAGQRRAADAARRDRRRARSARCSARSTACWSPICGSRRSSSRWRRWSRCATGCAGRRRAHGCRTCRPGFQWLGLTQALYPFVAIGACRRACYRHWRGRWATCAAGRAVYATGSNADAARLAGIRRRAGDRMSSSRSPARLTGLAAMLNGVRFNQIPSTPGSDSR